VYCNPFSIARLAAMATTDNLLLGNVGSGAMLAMGVALMLVVLLRRSGKYVHKLKRLAKKKRGPTVQEVDRQKMAGVFERASPLLDAPATVVRWQVEMQDLARDLKAEIDTKACLLQVLIRRSQEAAERLEAAAARAEQLGCIPPEDERISLKSLAENTGMPPVSTEPQPSEPMPPYASEVNSLADAGRNASDIATHLGLPLGDVEFVLSLTPRN